MLAFPTGPVSEQRASHQWAPIASDDHRSLCHMLSKQCADAALVCSGQEKPILGLWCYLTITDKVDLAFGVQYLPASALILILISIAGIMHRSSGLPSALCV